MNNPEAPDYYLTLQVHPLAEQDIIDAAYRRLIHKYHPDRIEPYLRSDPSVQQRIRAIIDAYAVLKDPQARARYDARRKHAEQTYQGVEQRIYPARCSRTKQEFDIFLARASGMSVFHVIGVGPVSVSPTAPNHFHILRHVGKLIRRLVSNCRQQRQDSIEPPTNEELERLFDERLIVDFGLIDWAGFICPVCNGEFQNLNGTLATWTICGKCSHLACAGAIRRIPGGGLKQCPWCGARRQLTYSVSTGTSAQKYVRGLRQNAKTSKPDSLKHLPNNDSAVDSERK